MRFSWTLACESAACITGKKIHRLQQISGIDPRQGSVDFTFHLSEVGKTKTNEFGKVSPV